MPKTIKKKLCHLLNQSRPQSNILCGNSDFLTNDIIADLPTKFTYVFIDFKEINDYHGLPGHFILKGIQKYIPLEIKDENSFNLEYINLDIAFEILLEIGRKANKPIVFILNNIEHLETEALMDILRCHDQDNDSLFIFIYISSLRVLKIPKAWVSRLVGVRCVDLMKTQQNNFKPANNNDPELTRSIMKNSVMIYIGRNRQAPFYKEDTNFNERLVQITSPGMNTLTFKYEIDNKRILKMEPVKYYNLYASKSELRWYEITTRVSFLKAFCYYIDESLNDTYDTRQIEEEINTLQQQKSAILVEKIFDFLRIPSSTDDGLEVEAFELITDSDRNAIRRMMDGDSK